LPARPRSLRLELVATLAIVLFMAVVSLSLAAEWLGQRRHDVQELDRLQDHARGVAALAAREFQDASRLDRDELARILHQSTASQLGVVALHVYVVSDAGAQTIESVGLAPDLPPPTVVRPRVEDMRETGGGLVVIDEPIPVFDASGRASPVLRVLAEPSPWTPGHEWPQTLLVAGGVGVVLLLLGSWLVELQVLGPLRAVERAAAQVAAGDLSVRLADGGASELQRLADAFERMTSALARQRAELEAQRDRLQRSEQLAGIGRLSAGVAHEVGNPLAAILGYVDFLADPRSGLDDAQREILASIRDQTRRIQAIVHQLLEYSRPGHSTARPVALAEHARAVAALAGADPRVASTRMEVFGSDDVSASADPGLLQQILLNLVVNGARASAERDHPRVAIRVGRVLDAPRAWIEVQDNGPGVSDEVRPRLFEPFFTTRNAGEGTGLGLAISQGLAESMRGELTCLARDARAPLADGEPPGATFRLELPEAAADDRQGA
jgi:signal transduction histidine kinase